MVLCVDNCLAHVSNGEVVKLTRAGRGVSKMSADWMATTHLKLRLIDRIAPDIPRNQTDHSFIRCALVRETKVRPWEYEWRYYADASWNGWGGLKGRPMTMILTRTIRVDPLGPFGQDPMLGCEIKTVRAT